MTPLPRVLCAVLLTAAVAFADDKTPPETPDAPPAEKKPEPKKDDKPKDDKPKEHAGKVTLGGAEVKYLAQTGTIPVLKDDGTPRADVFYVYYAATDADGKRLAAKDPATRSITFCFNGGPGASAVWLHLGGLGPRRLDLPADGLTPATVARIVDNPNSILDTTDLVLSIPSPPACAARPRARSPSSFSAWTRTSRRSANSSAFSPRASSAGPRQNISSAKATASCASPASPATSRKSTAFTPRASCSCPAS